MSIFGGFNLQEYLEQQERLRQEANDANQKRLDDILGIQDQRESANREGLGQAEQVMRGREGGVLGLLSGLGDSARRRAREDTGRRQGEDQQSLINRGLGRTTVVDQQRRARDRDLDDQLGRIDESVRTAQAGAKERTSGDLGNFLFSQTGALQGLMGDRQGFLERVTDMGPNSGDFLNLLSQYGQGGGMASGGGGGGGRSSRFRHLSPGTTVGRRVY